MQKYNDHYPWIIIKEEPRRTSSAESTWQKERKEKRAYLNHKNIDERQSFGLIRCLGSGHFHLSFYPPRVQASSALAPSLCDNVFCLVQLPFSKELLTASDYCHFPPLFFCLPPPHAPRVWVVSIFSLFRVFLLLFSPHLVGDPLLLEVPVTLNYQPLKTVLLTDQQVYRSPTGLVGFIAV